MNGRFMSRRLALVAALVFLAARLAVSQDSIAPDTVVAVKRATVLVLVNWDIGKASGSGFVVSVEKDQVLIATNYHVIAPPEYERGFRPTPSELASALKDVKVSVVFNSATKTEVTSKAAVIAADVDNDLAILRVTGLKDKPTAIDYRADPKVIETTTVYTFGFPLGEKLSTSKGNPAMTVGKASVSSIRHRDNGELAFIQIDGALNHGNSGGPVVDSKGQLVGVAVAKARDGEGIGLAIPTVDLVRLMKGRVCGLNAVTSRTASSKVSIQVEAEVADPAGAIREVTVNYLVIPRGAKWPEKAIDEQKGAKKASLKVKGMIASGEIQLDSSDGVVLFQAVPQGGAGIEGASAVRDVDLRGALAPGPGTPADASGPPPSGWKEHGPGDRTYTVWVPREWAKGQAERQRTTSILGHELNLRALVVAVSDGPLCVVEQGLLDEDLMRESPARIENLLRDSIVQEMRGRVFAQSIVRAGQVSGKEYRMEALGGIVRFRVFVSGGWAFILHVVGDRPTVESPGAQTFLDSFRPAGGSIAGAISGIPAERRSQILGGLNDPEFIDQAPHGGLLIGMEFALGKQENGTAIISGVRPLYRVRATEINGGWHGPSEGKDLSRHVARHGYVVGAISVATGNGVEGVSLTFMRVGANGRLDSRDTYESPWMGHKSSGSPVKLGGNGLPIVGLLGRKKASNVSGLGLLYADTSVPAPSGAGPIGPSPGHVQPSGETSTQKAGDSSTSPTKDADQKKGSSLTQVLILGGAIVLAAAFVGLYIYLQTGRSGAGSRRRRTKGRRVDDDEDEEDDDDEDDDEDDDDRPRRRKRRGGGRR
jgi:S1-C subfamily serine protease